MEAVSNSLSPASSINFSYQKTSFQYQSLVINATLVDSKETDTVSFNSSELNRALGLTADEIVAKLNEQLKGVLPNGLASVKPEDATPEATADRIVKAITGLFDVFSKSQSGDDDGKKLEEFMKQARAGVEQGYSEAYELLQGLGAFQFEGVEDGVKQTKALIEKKLAEFENTQREKLGIGGAVENSTSNLVSRGITTQGGTGVVNGSKVSVVA